MPSTFWFPYDRSGSRLMRALIPWIRLNLTWPGECIGARENKILNTCLCKHKGIQECEWKRRGGLNEKQAVWSRGGEVTCSCSAPSPLTSGRGRFPHSYDSRLPLKQLITPNSCIAHCTNPRHLAAPRTHSLRQSYRRPRTPTLRLLMASCSRLMFKWRGLACRPVISCAELWKHRLHFCGLLQTARRCLPAVYRNCNPKTAASAWLGDTAWRVPPRQGFDSRANSNLPPPRPRDKLGPSAVLS